MNVFDAYASGATTADVAKMLNVSISTARRMMLAAGILRSRGEATRLAAKRGRMGRKLGTTLKVSEAARKNIADAITRRFEQKPPVGKSVKPSGYVEFTTGKNKHKREHRVVAELMAGRSLRPNEVVHHKDGDKTNNHPSNLEIMDAIEHASLHARERHHLRNRNHKGQFK